MVRLRRSTLLADGRSSATVVRVGAVTNAFACPPCSCPSTFWKDMLLVVCFGAASALGAILIGKAIA